MALTTIFRRKKEQTDSETPQIRLKKPDPDYYSKKDEQTYQTVWKTTEFGIDEINAVIEMLKARNGHIWERARVAYIAGEIGKEFCYGYPPDMLDSIINYLMKELEGKTETMLVAGKENIIEEQVVGQPNIASVAALTALEKISTNDELYACHHTADSIIPKLKIVHKITAPELRPHIRQTIMNIKRICQGDTTA